MFGGPRDFIFKQETLKPKRTSETLGRLGSYFKRFWYAIAAALAFITVSTWMQVTQPQLLGQVVDCYLAPAAAAQFSGSPFASQTSAASASSCWLPDDVAAKGLTQAIIKKAVALGGFTAPNPASGALTTAERIAGLTRLVLILVVLFISVALLTGLTFFSMSWAGQHVLRQVRVALFKHLHSLPISYYAEHEVGDLMSRITNDSDTIQQALSFALVNVFSGILLLVWITYTMFALNVPFALLSIAIAPVMLLATLWFSSQARKAFRRTRVEMGSVNANLQESIAAVREAQAFNRAEENIEQFRQTSASYRDANVRAVAFTSALQPVLEALGYVALAIVSVGGGLALLNGSNLLGTVVSIGLVIAFLGYVQRFNQPISQISVLWSNIQSAVAGAERIFGLLDVKPAIQDKPDAKVMGEIKGQVEFDNVTAEYVPNELVLKNVSFVANPGQTVAIVGPTGAGKTTIINLIPRFYDVASGAVRVNGVDVRDVTAESLRKQIGIVLQDTFLFSTTVMENIRFGRPEASDEEIIAAAKLANADSFIERLPDKYQTVLGERGSGLSQGQRQLLAIARAALADPRILILDEATSSVDTRTERLIQKALLTLLKGRTSFVIAHRLSTIRNADVILVIKDGEIVERGKHQQLLDQKGFYYELYMSQFKKQEEVETIGQKVAA